MNTLINVVKSLIMMNGWTVIRLDIQGIYDESRDEIERYVAYLDIKGVGQVTVCSNGTFYK